MAGARLVIQIGGSASPCRSGIQHVKRILWRTLLHHTAARGESGCWIGVRWNPGSRTQNQSAGVELSVRYRGMISPVGCGRHDQALGRASSNETRSLGSAIEYVHQLMAGKPYPGPHIVNV